MRDISRMLGALNSQPQRSALPVDAHESTRPEALPEIGPALPDVEHMIEAVLSQQTTPYLRRRPCLVDRRGTYEGWKYFSEYLVTVSISVVNAATTRAAVNLPRSPDLRLMQEPLGAMAYLVVQSAAIVHTGADTAAGTTVFTLQTPVSGTDGVVLGTWYEGQNIVDLGTFPAIVPVPIADPSNLYVADVVAAQYNGTAASACNVVLGLGIVYQLPE